MYSTKRGLRASSYDKSKEIEEARFLYPFQNGNLFLLKEILLKGNFMYKFDLKDAYFCEFQLERSNLSVSLPLCLFAFHLGLAPKIFTKLLKVSIFLMRKLNVRLLIFLDDFLLITSSVRGSIWARNTLIYLIQNLDFQVNIKQTVLQPYQTIHCLGMEINSINMTITLLQEKKD